MKLVPFRSLPVIILLASAGCASHISPPADSPVEELLAVRESLPADFPTLLSLAHGSYSPYGPVEAVSLSLAAAEAALQEHPTHELAALLAARAATWLLEFDERLTREQALEMARKGFERAEAALDSGGARSEYLFLCGALLGQQLRLGHSPGLVKMRQVEDFFARAVDLDPFYDDGAPLRALGTLLIKAPPWPAGVGDEERGLELLRQGADLYPAHPASHLFLGDALVASGLDSGALAAYERTLSLCEENRWGAICATYGHRASAALAALQ